MKLFRVITILSSLLLANCASQTTQHVKSTQGSFNFPKPIIMNENQMFSLPTMVWNNIQYMRFTLNKEEKDLHQSAVFHALTQAHDGETTSWYSKNRLAQGHVRVVHSFKKSVGHCRIYQSYIQLNGKARHLTNSACKQYGQWTFTH